MTYQQFQKRYFRVWYERCFVTKIGDEVDALSQYVEPLNSRRDRKLDALPVERQEAYIHLWNRYRDFGITMVFFEFPRYSNQFAMETPDDLEKVKGAIQSALGNARILKASYMRELLDELLTTVREVTNEFHAVFGENIFA